MNNNVIKSTIIVGIITILQFSGCENNMPAEKMDIIAVIGSREIDWKHLQRSFEFIPKWEKGLTYKEAYRIQLDFLIDEKLFSQAAQTEGMQKNSKYSEYLDFIHKKEMIKELYRQQVKSKIKIPETEYKAAYLKMKKKVQFNYFFSSSLDHATAYQKSLKTYPFEEILLLDLKDDHRGTSPIFSYGDVQQELEEVIFDLKKGEISSPIEVADGYMVVQLIDGSIEKFSSELDFAEKKSKIQKIIFERKARIVANNYIKDLMLDKNLTLNPPIFYALSNQLSVVIKDKVSDTPIPIFVNDQEINLTSKNASDIIDEVLITYRHGEMTVRDFLDELMKMPADLRPNVKMEIQLKNAIGVIIRNKYLFEQARELGLSNHPNVAYEAAIQTDEILSKLWLKKYYESKQEYINKSKSDLEELVLNRNPDVINTEQKRSTEMRSELSFQELRMYASDSLKDLYHVTLDTSLLYNLVNQPQDTIRFDPVNMVVRELFN
jgi:hypothetical protein